MTQTLHSLYATRVGNGALRHDAAQEAALVPLERVRAQLTDRPVMAGWLGKLGLARKASPAIRGVYLWGDVGRGKSMLMDLLIEALPISGARRLHFHAFLRDLHAEVHAAQQAGARDAITETVDRFAKGLRLLALDEMDVSDIADAMLVDRVFRRLLSQGTVVVTTSNRPPDQLYRDGLKRELFLPFVALLTDHLDVVHIESPKDWRRSGAAEGRIFLYPLDDDTAAAFDRMWQARAQGAERAGHFEVSGRRVEVGVMAGEALRASFAELCEAPLGPGDYLELAARFDTLFLDRVPCLAPSSRDAARRFVMLIDALYEAKRTLVLRSETEVDRLLAGDLAYLGTKRLISRLAQMQTAEWRLAAQVGAA